MMYSNFNIIHQITFSDRFVLPCKYFEWMIKQLLNSAFEWYEDIEISEGVIHRAQAFGFGG